MKREAKTYVPPTIDSVSARDLVEALGPVSAGSGGGSQDDELWGSNGSLTGNLC